MRYPFVALWAAGIWSAVSWPSAAAFVSEFEFDDVIRLQRWDVAPEDPPGFLSPHVRCICEDERGHLWFGTAGGGVVEHDPSSGLWRHRVENDVFGNTLVQACAAEASGDVVFEVYGCDDVRYLAREDRLVRIEDEDVDLHRSNTVLDVDDPVLAWTAERFGSVSIQFAARIATASGEVWYGTVAHGVLVHDAVHGTWKHLRRFGDNPAQEVTDLHVDVQGRVWVVTREQGVSVYSYDDDSWTHHDVVDGVGAGGRRVRAAVVDARGRLWFGSTAIQQHPDVRYGGGITVYDPHEHSWWTWYGLDGEASLDVNVLWYDGWRHLWAGTETGLATLSTDEDVWSWQRDAESPGEAPVVSFGRMDGSIWAGTRDGTIHRQHRPGRWRAQGFPEGLPEDGETAILSIQPTQHVSLSVRELKYRWAFGADGRVYATDSAGDAWEPFEVAAWLPGMDIDYMGADEAGALWVHEHDGTVHVRDKLEAPWRTYIAPESAKSRWVTARFVGNDHTVWIGYDVQQLCRFDSPGYPDQCLTMDDGLGGLGVEAMVEDWPGDLWIGAPSYIAESGHTTSPGGTLTLLDRTSTGVQLPVVIDGLPGETTRAALVQGRSDELCWARPTGLAQTDGRRWTHARLDPVNDWDTALDGGPGGCWAGHLDGGVVWVEDGGLERRWTTRDGIPHDHVTGISQRPGTDRLEAWVATAAGAARLDASGVIASVESSQDSGRTPLGQVDQIFATADGGAVLVQESTPASSRRGRKRLGRLNSEVIRVSPEGAELSSTHVGGCGAISAIALGDDGQLWLGTRLGLFKLVEGNLFKTEIARVEYAGVSVRHLVSSGTGDDWTLWMALDRYPGLPATVAGYQPRRDRWVRVELGQWGADVEVIDMLEVTPDGTMVVMAHGTVFRGRVR